MRSVLVRWGVAAALVTAAAVVPAGDRQPLDLGKVSNALTTAEGSR